MLSSDFRVTIRKNELFQSSEKVRFFVALYNSQTGQHGSSIKDKRNREFVRKLYACYSFFGCICWLAAILPLFLARRERTTLWSMMKKPSIAPFAISCHQEALSGLRAIIF